MFKEKLVGILGAGVEGVSSAAFLKNQGAFVTLIDQKTREEFDPVFLKAIDDLHIQTDFGREALKKIGYFEVLVRTPGIRPDIPEIDEAVKKGAVLTSNAKIFFELCPAKIIGVTGTKGKGTTATLIQRILQEAGMRSFLGGNIGTAPLDLLSNLTPNDYVVLELSSFQLIDLDKSPFVAVVLMVTSEHLDWHTSAEEYKKAKFNLVSHQSPAQFAVINVDYPSSREFLDQTQARKIQVSTKQEINNGVFLANNAIYRRVGAAVERVMVTNEVGLVGKHNLENVLAAVGAASAFGVRTDIIAKTIREFKGLEHRLEFVGEKNGVKFFNDSFSTTPETAVAALKSFSEKEILILGGSDKGSDYTELGKEIVMAPNLKAIVLVGQMGPKIKEAIGKAGKFKGEFLEGAKNMSEIVDQAKSVATSGDVILLSPACASFDMFKNYKNRGEEFRRVVNSL